MSEVEEISSKQIKDFLVNNPESIYLEQWIDDLKKAKNILDNPTSYDELVKENDRLSSIVLNYQKFKNVKVDAEKTISERL